MSFLDTRLGNTPRWYIEAPENAHMRVPDAALKSVCFLGVSQVDQERDEALVTLGGTGFFVLHVSEFDPDIGHIYLVTAKHVADQLIDKEFAVRLNKVRLNSKGVDALWVKGKPNTRWYTHPTDKIADVAILPFGPPSNADFVAIPSTMFLTEAVIEKGTIGPGDEVFITGLFAHLLGMFRNRPIVRVGNLAMLPEYEKVPTAMGFMPAYLIEARSIGGLSGSPVFVTETLGMRNESGEILAGGGAFYFMGLMHGHWDIPAELKNDIPSDKEGKVNMGIAIVVPAITILEVINQEELVEMRRQRAEEEKKKKPLPTMDTLIEPSQNTRAGADIRIPLKSEFTRDLNKATRRKKPS